MLLKSGRSMNFQEPRYKLYRVCQKIDVGFFNPKNVTILVGYGIDQNQKYPSFLPIGQKISSHTKLEIFM